MLVLRSLLFNVAFYALTILWLIGLIPFVLFPRKTFLRAVQAWGGPRSGSCASSPARGSSSAASSASRPAGSSSPRSTSRCSRPSRS